jgi:DNA repair exonuclease SbcCD nuclease subunit
LDRHEQHLDQLIRIAEEQKVSFALVSGDLFEDARTSIPELLAAVRFFRKLTRVCPVIATAGNHDELTVGKFQTQYLQRLKIPNLFLVDGIESFTWDGKTFHPTEDEKPGAVSVLASRWTGLKHQEEFDQYLKASYRGESIVMLHECFQGSSTDVGYVAKRGIYPPALEGIRAYCLGDIHKHQRVQHPYAFFSGAPLQMNFGDKPGKGCLIWTIQSPFDYQMKFHEVPSPIQLKVAYRLEDIPSESSDWWQLRVPANQIPPVLPDCVKDTMPLAVELDLPVPALPGEFVPERPSLRLDYREGVQELLTQAQYEGEEIDPVLAEIEKLMEAG